MKTSLDLRSTILGAIIGGVAALTIAATTDKGATRWEYSVELGYFKHADPEYAKIQQHNVRRIIEGTGGAWRSVPTQRWQAFPNRE